MNVDKKEHLAVLVEKQIGGSMTAAEHAELEALLLESEEVRGLFLDLTAQHAQLQGLGESLAVEELRGSRTRTSGVLRWASAVAAVAAAGVFAFLLGKGRPSAVAILASSENAAWESVLPTTLGSELVPGVMELKSGVATIRFGRGAEVTLEAPAKIALETAMRGRLYAGSAVVDVPESAIGFVMETADSYAVDHGTQFAVTVAADGERSFFEVLSGEISVHHTATEQSMRLYDGEALVGSESGIEMRNRLLLSGELPDRTSALRFESAGREATSIRDDDTAWLHPNFLMAKRSVSMDGFDRKSVFGFKLREVDRSSIATARIRLNLVPCGLGYASRLPATSRFALYGVLPEDAPSFADAFLPWDEAPLPENSALLGHFELSRGEQTSSVLFEEPALVDFLRSFPEEEVSFLLVRETDEEQVGGLVHAFAAHGHPTASGPALEINY